MRSILFRFKGSVIRRVTFPVIFCTVYSVAIVALRKYAFINVTFPELPFHQVLGTVIGMLLVFRTNTGYDRYYEGRRLWSDLITKVRNLSRMIWLGVKEESQGCTHRLEKRSAINILIALVYATKNFLRKDFSYDKDPDLEQLIRHLPKFQAKPEPNIPLWRRPTCILNRSDHNQNGKASQDYKEFHIKRENRHHNRRLQLGDKITHAYDYSAPTNIPMELLYYFQTFVLKVEAEKRISMDNNRVMLIQIDCNELASILTQMEKILKTPIPLAYSIHLHQAVFIYLLSLPFSMVEKMGWFTILAQAAVSFCMLGMLAIGWEIENPFGFDQNDLPLDDYCDVLRQEIERFVRRPFPTPESWVLHQDNVPFAPYSYRNACDLNLLSYEELDKVVGAKGEGHLLDKETGRRGGIVNSNFKEDV